MKDHAFTVVDLFSGAGGMSSGFHAHPLFQMIGAVDAQFGKPSTRESPLQCNMTYAENIGITPIAQDLHLVNGEQLKELLAPVLKGKDLTVLSACPPCTGFSRANPNNHLADDTRNTLVGKVADWAKALRPRIIVMENARELMQGNFSHHYANLAQDLERLGYKVHGSIHMLNRFGLPQKRERALVIAVQQELELKTLDQLWDGYKVKTEATYVRRAISHLPELGAGETHSADPMHYSPNFSTDDTLKRLMAIPTDGGSWIDLKEHHNADGLLTPAMKRNIAEGKLGSHPDVYGRMWWDRPAPTIKRECGHIGNGRYAHPEQHRLCSVRELATLQGFPSTYIFKASTKTNMYRHVGDAVPPLVSFQIAKVCEWVLTGRKPDLESCILPNTHLRVSDLEKLEAPESLTLFDLMAYAP